jgi:hypothetical protein
VDEWLSYRKFAEVMNTSEANVRKAVKAGKLTEASISFAIAHRPKVHVERGRAEWNKNFYPERIQNQKLADSLAGKQSDEDEPEPGVSVEDSDGNIVIDNNAPYSESLRLTQLFKAKNAQLEYNERRGKLVDKDSVYKEYFAIAQSVRAAMQGIPDKIVDHMVAAGNDRTEAHRLLYAEITESLEALSMKPQFK